VGCHTGSGPPEFALSRNEFQPLEKKIDMKRRDFLKTTAAVAGASVATRLGFSQNVTETGSKPNAIFILVDELRWPTVFPIGVNSAEEYFKRFMPKLYQHVWQGGVKFSNYHTAACACTPCPRHDHHWPILSSKLAHDHHPQQSQPAGPQSCISYFRQTSSRSRL
jgi:hypothetical protein